jgi:Xaa-Pro aminopeptidase
VTEAIEVKSDADVRSASFEQRHRVVREAVGRLGADVLVAYGCGTHVFIGSNPAWYLSGFRQMGPHMAVVLPLDSEPFVVVTPKWDVARARERSAIADVVACEPDEFLDQLSRELGHRGLAGKRFALAQGEQTPPTIAKAWDNVLGGGALPAAKLVSDIARIRDDWSMICTRKGVRIAEDSYDWLLGEVRPGMWEHEVVAKLEVHIRELGAEDNFQLMSSAQHNRSVHMPTRRLMAQGDILLGEITPSVEGEFIQICRTAVLGTSTQAQRDGFALLDHALREGMRTATPGTPVDDVVEAINAPIAAAGYERYTKPPFMRTRGHSMAMGSMDPEIAFNTGQVLLEGMVFVMHPNQYLPDVGYMMCGEPVIITKEGAKPLTQHMGTLGSIG